MGTVVGLFETRDQAQQAVEALTRANFQRENISIVMRDRDEATALADDAGVGGSAAAGAVGGGLLGGIAGLLVGLGALAIPGIGPIIAAGPLVAALTGGAIGAATGGLLGALVDAGVPEEEARVYQTGVERGGILVSVNAPNNREAEARSILQQNGMRDANYHRNLLQNNNFKYDTRRTDMAKDNKSTPDKTVGGTLAGGAAGAAAGMAVGGPVGAAAGAVIGGAAGAAAGSKADYDESYFRNEYNSAPYRSQYSWDQANPAYRYGFESYSEGQTWDKARTQLQSGWKGQGRFADYEPMIRSGYERRSQYRADDQGRMVIPVVEEELQVGKRAVERGGARVNVDVEEVPVEEQVRLREERVTIERRPVNREVTAADASMFKEGTLDVTEMAEEAVVNKRARVVEEVVVGKEVTERTETVRDTVRRTDVDVQQTGGTQTSMTGMQTGRTTDFTTYDTAFRNDFNTRFGRSGATYDQYMPIYRYGYDLASSPDYQGREWRDIEADARTGWEQNNQGTWNDFKDAVRYAWDQARGRR